MNELISIIVPVYNVERFLDRCVQSLLDQSYSEFEIILVDDGSTDSSGEKCDDWAKKTEKIKVFHKPNGGLSSARNFAIDRASGSLLTFVDSDDYVKPDYLLHLFDALSTSNADFSICDCFIEHEDDSRSSSAKFDTACEISKLDQEEAILKALDVVLPQRAWGKLYRKSLFDDIRFPNGKLYEDLAVYFSLLMQAKNGVALTSADDYVYMLRKGSIMHTGDFNMKKADEIEVVNDQMDAVLRAYPELKEETTARRIYSYFIVLRRILYSDNKKDFVALRKSIRKDILNMADRDLMASPSVNRKTKIKIKALKIGERAYFLLQRIADRKNPEMKKGYKS